MKVYCDDWSCPARVSCAHHFGRSAAYAGMREGAKVESVVRSGIYKRDANKDSCGEYRLDRPKDWLMPQPGDIACVPYPDPLFGLELLGLANGDPIPPHVPQCDMMEEAIALLYAGTINMGNQERLRWKSSVALFLAKVDGGPARAKPEKR